MKFFGERLAAAIEWAFDQQAVIGFAEGDVSPEPLRLQESGGIGTTSLCAARAGGAASSALAVHQGARVPQMLTVQVDGMVKEKGEKKKNKGKGQLM